MFERLFPPIIFISFQLRNTFINSWFFNSGRGEILSEIRYICRGNCGSMITVERFKSGQKTCVEKKCDSFGQKLERGEYCASCNTCFEEGEDHICI